MRLTLTVVLSFVLWTAPLVAQDKPKPLTSEQQAKLKERDQLLQEVQKIEQTGKFNELHKPCEAILKLEREVYGEFHPDIVNSLIRISQNYELLEEFSDALPARKEALALLEKHRGKDHWEAIDVRQSIEDIQRLAKMSAEARRALGEARELNVKGLQLFRMGKYADALKTLQQGTNLVKQSLGENHPEYATNLGNLGVMCQTLGDMDSAMVLFQRVIEIRKKSQGEAHPEYGTSLNNLAFVHRERGAYTRALPLLEQAVATYKKALGGEHTKYALGLNNLALLYQTLGKFDKALPMLEESTGIWKKALGDDHPDYAQSLNNLAMLHQAMGAYSRCAKLLDESKRIVKKRLGETHPLYSAIIGNQSLLQQTMGAYDLAVTLREEGIRIDRKVFGDNHPNVADGLRGLATLYRAKGAYDRALPLTEQAIALIKKHFGDQHPTYALVIEDLAALYQLMGDLDKAVPLSEKALTIRKASLGKGHPVYAGNLLNLASLYEGLGRHRDAVPLYEEALPIIKNTLGGDHTTYAIGLNNLGRLHQNLKSYDDARRFYTAASDIFKESFGADHPSYASTLENLAAIHQTEGDYDKALPLFEKSLAIRKKALGTDHPAYAESLHNLALLQYAAGSRNEAVRLMQSTLEVKRTLLRDTLPTLSNLQRRMLLETTRKELEDYLTLIVVQKGPYPEAYTMILAWKGLLGSFQSSDRSGRDEPELKTDYAELRDVQTRLAHLSLQTPESTKHEEWLGQLRQLRDERDRRETELARKSTIYRKQQRKPLTPEGLASVLPKEVAFVDFMQYTHQTPDPDKKGKWKQEPRLLAVVTLRDARPVVVAFEKSEEILKQIEGWRTEIDKTQPDAKKLTETASTLRKLLWEPLVPHLGDRKTVLLSPDGLLCQFPFAALPGSKSGTYLLEEYTLGSFSSAQQLVDLLSYPEPKKASGLLAIGGIEYGKGEEWGPLPGSTLEAKQCQERFTKAFSEPMSELLSGDKATPSTLRKGIESRPQYLHLATHGFFEKPDQVKRLVEGMRAMNKERMQLVQSKQSSLLATLPLLRSGIVLAGANEGTEGLMLGEELSNLDLRGCKLAVLSACQTGQGDINRGDGVNGLQRTFHAAGCETVIASLWHISDPATAVLMEQFYGNLWDRKMGRLEALRQAQLYVLKNPDKVQEKGKELIALLEKQGVSKDLLRGPKSKFATPLPESGSSDPQEKRSPPQWWAAFLLSGDWR